ncbi:MAG: hypothetical protein ACE5F6_05475 [Anaerolineae bacterium]
MTATLLLALSRVWQVALLAFWVHYLALAGLVVQIGPLARGGLRILMGGLICLMLFLTARRLGHGRAGGDWLPRRRDLSAFVFRLAGVALAGIGVFGTTIPARFPSLPAELVVASVWLMALGFVVVVTSREALWAGMGLLLASSGFETLYTALDPRLVVAGLLAVGGLLLALMVAIAIAAADQRTKQLDLR